MHIIELSYPGTWIDHSDQQWSWEVLKQIRNFETPLAEAALALTWFEEQLIVSRATHYEDQQTEWQRVQEIRDKYVSESGLDPFTVSGQEQIRLHTEIEVKRERWGRGLLPENYRHQIQQQVGAKNSIGIAFYALKYGIIDITDIFGSL